METLKLGELFAGYGGLGLAVQDAFGAEVSWVSEIEPDPSRVLEYRFPHAPNLGDLTKINWHEVEPVDILSGGSPARTSLWRGNVQVWSRGLAQVCGESLPKAYLSYGPNM